MDRLTKIQVLQDRLTDLREKAWIVDAIMQVHESVMETCADYMPSSDTLGKYKELIDRMYKQEQDVELELLNLRQGN